jgi:hypothetical protein
LATAPNNYSERVKADMWIPSFITDKVLFALSYYVNSGIPVVTCGDTAIYECPLLSFNPLGGTNFTLRQQFSNGCLGAPSSIFVGSGGG